MKDVTAETQTYKLNDTVAPGKKLLAVGILALAVTAIGAFVDSKQFFHSYLTAFVFWLTIGLGGLFFTMLHHVVGAKWSVVLRRISETLMSCVPMLAVLFLPILLFGMHTLYHWTHADAVAHDAILQKKASYLNMTFFTVRAVFYFVVWFILARFFYKNSVAQDQSYNAHQATRMRQLSAPGLILFAVTITFAATDWLMSLDPHWFSTIFGVYVFAGSVMAALAFMILTSLYLRRHGFLQKTITVEHYHDLGKLLFAFMVFWSYVAFSQYMLIWYSNIPEETAWFLHRWQGSWKFISLLVAIGHFALPFLILLPRAAKRNFKVLAGMAVWLLFIHWIDMYWIVLPNLHHHGVHFSWMDVTAVIGIGGVFKWYFWQRLSGQALVPVNDPNLQTSIEFVNH